MKATEALNYQYKYEFFSFFFFNIKRQFYALQNDRQAIVNKIVHVFANTSREIRYF